MNEVGVSVRFMIGVRVEQEEEAACWVELCEECEVSLMCVAMCEGVEVGLVGWRWCGWRGRRVDDRT